MLDQCGQPLAKCAIANLVMVLQEQHEGCRRQMGAWHPSRATEIIRMLALINKSFGQASCQLLHRAVAIISVVAGVFAGEKDMQHIVAIIVPLCIDILRQVQ